MALEIKVIPKVTLFFNEEEFYGIYGVEVHEDYMTSEIQLNQYGNISIKGLMPKLHHGQEYLVKIVEDSGNGYKGSYTVESIKQDRPESIADQRRFLETILTPLQVVNIYDVYNEDQDVVGLIENGEFEFGKVKGMGAKSFENLKKRIEDNVDMSEVLVFLAKYGIKYNMISKLVKEYKNPQIVIQKIQENPYILTEIKGIGFTKADEIAKAVGYSMTSPHRINSCLLYCIGEENQNGHSWVSRKQLLNKAMGYLNIEKSLVIMQMDSEPKGIKNSEDRFTKESIYEAEKYVAMKMTEAKVRSKKLFKTEELEILLTNYCEENNVELEENQRQFFHDWNENSILLLIGGGGMGKSWLQRILLDIISKKNLTTALLAPTGKASKVMTNYTGRQASTIHRKAGVFEEEGESSKPIQEDVIIIDESSMCDIFILAKFFGAVTNTNARILFVGDDFQLPSVGVGNFLYDVINSTGVKVSKLKKVFRQATGGILNVATDVREGKKFLNDNAEGRIVFGKDCVFWLTDSKFVRDGVIHNYTKVLQRFKQEDIVILTPTNKGRLGTVELNREIQKIANPASSSKKQKIVGAKGNETVFRVGDAVMNIVNTYDAEMVGGGTADIFNGDTGVIIDIDEEGKVFVVEIDGLKIKMKFGTILTTMVHSWVTTIHKSQGSQYKVVIIIIDSSSTYQLNANLIYTGLSRATDFLLVLGQASTINKGIDKFANMERRSFMQEFIIMFNSVADKPIDGYVDEANDGSEEDFENEIYRNEIAESNKHKDLYLEDEEEEMDYEAHNW